MTRPGIKPTNSQSQGGHSTTGPLSLRLVDLLGCYNVVTLTQPHSEPEVVVQAVSGRQDPVSVDQDTTAV